MAKVEIKLVVASLLLGYDYKLVDSTGRYPSILPVPDRNDIHQVGFSGVIDLMMLFLLTHDESLALWGILFTLTSSAWLTSFRRDCFTPFSLIIFFAAHMLIYLFMYQHFFNPKFILGRTSPLRGYCTGRITVSELVTCSILNRLIDGLGPQGSKLAEPPTARLLV